MTKQRSAGGRPAAPAEPIPPLLRDLAFREFIAELFAAAAGMQSLRRAIAKSIGLGSAELAVLLGVWRLAPAGPVGIKRLAEHLHVAGPHVTDEAARLVARGYLRKAVDRSDARAVDLRLTARGQRLLTSLAPMLERINLGLFEGMTTADMRRLRALFRQLIARSAGAAGALAPRRGGRR